MDSVRWENDDEFRAPALSLTIRSCWEHSLVGGGIQCRWQFFDQTSLDATSFTRWNQVADNRFEPGIFVYAKNHTRSLVHFQFVDGGTGQQVTKCLHARYHFLAQLFLGNLLHRAGDEFEIGVESDIE